MPEFSSILFILPKYPSNKYAQSVWISEYFA